MNKKRIAAAVTSLACCAGVAGYMPQVVRNTSTYAAELVYNDFEANYDGWYGNADAVKLTAENGKGYEASRGMTITGRTSPKDGASSSKGFYLSGGVEYKYSVQVYSETEETFRLSLLCIDEETGKETEVELAEKKVKAGEWTEISAEYEAPENSYEFRLTLNTDSTNDFSFDEVLVTSDEEKAFNEVHAASSNMGLKDAFGQYFRVGNILNGNTVRNSTITASYLKDYNSIECENETKPDATLVQSQCNGTNIGVSLNSCSAIMDFCVRNGIGMRGHAFVWHSQTPSWFFKEGFSNNGNWVSSSTMTARLDSYIKNMFNAIETQYPDLNLYAYDVVNEAVSDDSNRTANNGGAREPGDNNVTGGKSAWVQVYGSNSFVETAFTIARKYAPEGCDLYYNDYNEYWDHKRDCIYNMCKSLYDKGLLDGVGMQSHISAQYDGFTGVSAYTTAMKKYLSIGCDVQITELDISRENGTYSEQQQADKYKAIFQAAVDWNKNPTSNGRVTAVCIWGPNDANSWLKAGSNALLYNGSHQPKPAYTTLMSMIPESEWVEGGYEGGEIKAPEPNQFGWYFQDPFEGDLCTWEGRGAATIMTSGRTAYVGSESLLVQNRESAWNGAYRNLNPRAFVPGQEFSFSANVMYFDGGDTDTFYMKLQYVDANGETQYSTIAEGTALKGEWMQLSNTNYKIPADATNLQLYIETAETTNNFYIDEAIGAVAGTGILGPGQPEIKKVILGDVDFDGRISALDVTAARNGLLKGISDSFTKQAADVDQSGVYEVADLILIQNFILRRIDKFPVAEKVIDTAAMEQLFSTVNIASSYKKDGENNVLWTHRFGADPGFMVYKDRLYVYTTNDAIEYRNDGQIQVNTYNSGTINCFSTADLVNWTDHGPIPVAGRNGRTQNGAAKWATYAWAPDAAWKTINGKDKFFLYFADSAGGIGVLTADSPEGPYTDPIGKALINKSTPGFGDVEWLFDPAVLVDDDGSGYLYVGGGVPSGKAADPGTARAIKLGNDMTSLSGDAVRMNPPYLFEDSSILKVNGTYYYSYCTNWNTGGNPYGFNNAEIAVMTSNNPLGPFTYKGIALKNPASYRLDGGGNNHHSIVEFKGKYYVIYHSRNLSRAMNIQALNTDGSIDLGGNYRSPHIDEATFSNGMFSATGTMKGVSQIETLNPYKTVQAETMSNQSKGIVTNGLYDTKVVGKKGEWIKTSGVNFSNGTSKLTVRASSTNGAAIKICAGSTNGDVIGYVEVPAGGNFSEITVPVNNISGTKDVYFVFSDQLEFDSWSFQ
ncbi:MAG: carbohydrate-binding protein [Ruminococcus sp.]|nr:carbohydrate-binding protein [Ruminococcus sp.]